ncbi:MFS transporter, DHA1 family [Actinokineospora spheciospongiae]|uniref:MFS transporter, DHA1 family n=1 Tax=Actinokineospora spheciospongiae TaxID=909613 RepID=W7INA5_9PSEU|nr:MFS transporter [Actinokineospora spheciospongiae]EWC62355.1 MFS transporter, DHA1 family [Actinokineospora spheciospongiae]
MSTPQTTRDPSTAAGPDAPKSSPLPLAVAFLTLLAIGTDLFVVSPLLPAIAGEYGVSIGAAGTSVTAFSLAYMVGAPLGGTLADRVGRRGVLVIGLTGFALANILTGLPLGFGPLLVARVIAGLFAAGVTPSLLALVGQSAPPARRGFWMSTAMAGFLISLTTGAPTGTAVAAVLGWESAFFGIGILALVLAVVNRFIWPRGAGAVAPQAGAGRVPLATKLRAVSVTGIWAFAVYSFYTYLGSGLEDVAGLSTGVIATALIVYGLGAVAGSLSGGRLADRYGAGRVAVTSLLLLAVALVVVDLLVHAPAWLLLVSLGLFALTAYPCLPAYQSRLVATFPTESGSVLAWNSFFMYLGTSVGSAVGGALLSSAGFRWIPVVGAIAAVIGAVVYHRWSLPRQKVGETA